MNATLKSILQLAGALVGLIALLALISVGIVSLTGQPTSARPTAQTPKPGLSLVDSTEQNNCAAYLQSQGYHVDAVGYPAKPDGSPDADSVVLLMPVESPQFDPNKLRIEDQETLKQVLLGFSAAYHFFPKPRSLAVGLEWGQYIILFPIQASSWQAFDEENLSVEELWGQALSAMSVIDANTWRPVQNADFIYKDFSAEKSKNEGLPPASERPPTENGRIRLQPSTAYLPTGEDATLIATASEGASGQIAGQNVEFAYTPRGEDPISIVTATVGADGAARALLHLPPNESGQIIVSARTDGMPSGAAAPITLGPTVTGADALNAISDSLRLQGYNILNALNQAGRASVMAEMVSPRFDDSVRAELLSIAGTLFTVFPQTATVEPVLLYRSQGLSYQLIYGVNRQDWEAWIKGTIDETQLWQRFNLQKIMDAVTGQPVSQRDFIGKNFGTTGQYDIQTLKTIESRLVKEPWGDQLYTAKFTAPVGGLVDAFTLIDSPNGTTQEGFSIYKVTEPLKPLYRSAGDADGSKLKQLSLEAGQYKLSIESNIVPATIRLSYIEHLIDSARMNP